MESKMYRVGIVGAGFGLNVHLPAFRLQPNCEVISVVTSSEQKNKEIAEKYGFQQVYASWEDLVLNGNLDIIAIATPPDVQMKIIENAMAKGIRIFAEKPLALNTEQADRLILLNQKHKVPFAYDVEFMELPQWKLLKQQLDHQTIGEVQRVVVDWEMMTYANERGLSNWKTTTDQGGGALSAFCSHVFYYLEEFLGPIEKLSAMISRDKSDDRPTDTLVQINCVFVSGVEGHININTKKSGGSLHQIEFFGSLGQLQLVNKTKDYMHGFEVLKIQKNESTYQTVSCEKQSPKDFADGRIFAVNHLISRWMQSFEKFNPGLNEAYRNQKLIHAASDSHQKGQWVSVIGK